MSAPLSQVARLKVLEWSDVVQVHEHEGALDPLSSDADVIERELLELLRMTHTEAVAACRQALTLAGRNDVALDRILEALMVRP